MKLGINVMRKIMKFRKDYPQFKDFRFWQIKRRGNKLVSALGQARINGCYYGHIYHFDFVNKFYKVIE